MAGEHEAVDEVGADEACAAGDEDPLAVVVVEKANLRVLGVQQAGGADGLRG